MRNKGILLIIFSIPFIVACSRPKKEKVLETQFYIVKNERVVLKDTCVKDYVTQLIENSPEGSYNQLIALSRDTVTKFFFINDVDSIRLKKSSIPLGYFYIKNKIIFLYSNLKSSDQRPITSKKVDSVLLTLSPSILYENWLYTISMPPNRCKMVQGSSRNLTASEQKDIKNLIQLQPPPNPVVDTLQK